MRHVAQRPPKLSRDSIVHWQNYYWMKTYVTCLGRMLRLHPDLVLRYWFYLRHILLWADETLLCNVADLRPTLPAYLSEPPANAEVEPQPLTPTSTRRIIQCARRFFVWAKITFPREFRALPTAWIERLRPLQTGARVNPLVRLSRATRDRMICNSHVAISQTLTPFCSRAGEGKER